MSPEGTISVGKLEQSLMIPARVLANKMTLSILVSSVPVLYSQAMQVIM